MPDRLFKRHRRWCLESAKDGYVKDSLESRLQVVHSLGLYFDVSYTPSLFPLVVKIINNSQPSVVAQLNMELVMCGHNSMLWEM